MSIKELVEGRKEGKAGHWQIISYCDDKTASIQLCELWHHSTMMLRWRVTDPYDPDYLQYNIGWGSVSDQNGMNIAFRVLGLPLSYHRDIKGGGPRIEELCQQLS